MPLSDEQRAALWDESGHPVTGRSFLSARPGTGKTTTVTDYCIDVVTDWHAHHEPWQGIAVLSYTNVAKDELETRVRRAGLAHALLRPPHFVGTLDAFINQHVFLPHGASAMGYAGTRPILVGEPYYQWIPSWPLRKARPPDAYDPVFFDCYALDRDDQPMLIDTALRLISANKTARAQKVTDRNTSKIAAMKRYVWNHGGALQADANYLAYQTLRSSIALAAALARRFPVLVVDEAQDMTELQHAIVDTLVSAGLDHVVLVGDENQAIYEWNTARPDLFTASASVDGRHHRVLRESYRCSPAICATLTEMAADGITLTPAIDSKNRGYSMPVNVREYDTNDEATVVGTAIDSIAEALDYTTPHNRNEAGIKTLAVISRSADDARRLHALYTDAPVSGSDRVVWANPLTRDFLKVVHHVANGESERAVRAYEHLLTRAEGHESIRQMREAVMRRQAIPAADNVGYRILLFTDLRSIAAAITGQRSLRISECVDICKLPLAALHPNRRIEISQDCATFSTPAKTKQDRLLLALFAARDERSWLPHTKYASVCILFSTVHAVKGETHDAVVFHTKHRVYACGCPASAGTWNAVLQHSILDCETKRIAYVACSRAAQALLVLTQAGSLIAWQSLAWTTAQPRR